MSIKEILDNPFYIQASFAIDLFCLCLWAFKAFDTGNVIVNTVAICLWVIFVIFDFVKLVKMESNGWSY